MQTEFLGEKPPEYMPDNIRPDMHTGCRRQAVFDLSFTGNESHDPIQQQDFNQKNWG